MSALALLVWPLSALLFGGGFFGARALAARALGLRGAWVPFRRFDTGDANPPSRWARPVMIVAGPLGSYLVAAALIATSALLAGQSEADNLVTVRAGAPADTAGLQDGDRIVRLAGTEVRTFEEISASFGPTTNLRSRWWSSAAARG